jgi:hypothetical protein
MRGLLHLLATLVVLPYVALAGAFVLLGGVIAGGSLFGMLRVLLAEALWLIPWGFLGCGLAIVVVIALGVGERTRWLGALCLFVIASACLVVILALPAELPDLGQIVFLLPCIAVLAFSGWLAASEWRGRVAAAVPQRP